MDEVTGETATVGERLRSARLAQDISLEDVASRTRIPTRHLESLEASEWSRLPAPTYTIGFARSYAGVLGLDRTEIADALRLEMGAGTLAPRPEAQVFEPADPARVMPRWLVILALLALLGVVAAFLLMRNRELSGPDEVTAPVEQAAPASPQTDVAPAPAAAASTGPVVITATEPAWIQISERGGRTLFAGELATGQSFEVPATASAPVLRTGRPQSIRVAVGTTNVPPVGAPDTVISNVSLVPADLLRGPAATPPATSAPAAR
jgi:cytoskeletal protein RodZ